MPTGIARKRGSPTLRLQAAAGQYDKVFPPAQDEEGEESVGDWDAAEEDDAELTCTQVEMLLGTLCEETDLAEVELDMGSTFHLKVRRSLKAPSAQTESEHVRAAPPPPPPPPPSARSVPGAPLAALSGAISSDEESEEARLVVVANKVGIVHRRRAGKGKAVGRGPLVNVGDKVKKGQVLVYVDQMGVMFAVEAPQAGEIREMLVDDGDAVEYNQPVAEMSPFFGH